MTVARSKRSLSGFAALVRATCSDGQRDWTRFVLPRGSKSFVIKRGRVAKRISLGPPGSPAVGHLSVAARFGRAGVVSGSLSGTWRYSDGTTCNSGGIAFRLRRGRYAPPLELSERHPQHPPLQPTSGQPTLGATATPPVPPQPLPPPAPGTDSESPNPAPGGQQFPNRASTGVPSGWVPQQTRSTSLTVSSAGAVVQDIRFTDGAGIFVRAPNVTIRRVELQGGMISNQVGSTCPGPGLMIEDSSLGPMAGQQFLASDVPAIESGGYTARRVEIWNRGEGFRGSICGPLRVEDSFAFIHSSTTLTGCSGDLHSDGYQSYGASGGTFVNNTFIFPIHCGTAPFYAGYGYPQSSCAGQPRSSCPANSSFNTGTYNVNRLLIAGGGYPFRQQTPGSVTGLRIVNNAWAFGPIDNRCSVLGPWEAKIVTLGHDYRDSNGDYRVTGTIRDQPCNTDVVE